MTTEVAAKKTNLTAENRKILAKMGEALGLNVDPDMYAAEVLRTGDKVILPEGASIPEVIKVLQNEYDSERQKVSVNTSMEVPPWDGAIALTKAIHEKLGLVQALEIPGGWFSPDQPPTEMEVEYDYGKTMTVRWGRFALPGMQDAVATTGIKKNETTGEYDFTVQITTTRRWQQRAREILDLTREYALVDSIHKGKAFAIQFYNNDGEQIQIPTPSFFQFSKDAPIFRTDLEKAIERNILTPIRHAKALKAAGYSLKRGVLFAGHYGTGKTMLASSIANVAVQEGWTFIYVKDPQELPLALKYAKKFQPVVVFCEDVDRVAGMERDNDVNQLLNQLDGVDSKSASIFTILTSNHSDKVNKAMRRPGRIDMVLQVLPPDAETIVRMVKRFVGTRLEPNANLIGIGTTLEGFAPAYIQEACGRAGLEALRRTGNLESLISGEDLTTVAKEVQAETEMFTGSDDDGAADNNTAEIVAAGFDAAGKIITKRLAGQSKVKAEANVTRQ
jgi:transitional endoplasmic reticulum ATPase